MKRLEFIGSSRDDLRNFPAEARRAAGFQMSFVQQGLMPLDWKPMKQRTRQEDIDLARKRYREIGGMQ